MARRRVRLRATGAGDSVAAMFAILRQRTYRHLFAAQVVSLVGTGLATVALGLLAYDLAGGRAGAVLGTALAIKMIAYVSLAPVAAAIAARVPRRAFLVGLDLFRAVAVIGLPFVTEVWQVYVLIFLFQAASAGFTPAFQATIPDVLPGEEDYTNALSLSRLAEDLETLLSPMLAALLLTMVGFPVLFAGTVAGFVLSALLVVSVRLPLRPPPSEGEGVWEATTKGLRVYLATPRLRGALAVEFATAAAGAMVLVNTVVIVRATMGLGDSAVAVALAAFGGGSMLAALMMPRLLAVLSDRAAMLAGAALMVAGVAAAGFAGSLTALLPLWAATGFGFALTQTPVGRLLVRSAQPGDRPAVYAAQFALSHACWLVSYPLAGWAGAALGLRGAFATLTVLGAAGFAAALALWPARDPESLPHSHPDLPPGHPHLADHATAEGHPFRIDRLHPTWPKA